MKQFAFPSSSSDKTYHTMIGDNGLLSCDCPGWTVKKLNKVRECKHTKKVAGDLGLSLIERDGQWFVMDPADELMREVSGAASIEGVQSSPSPAHGDRMGTTPLITKRQETAPEVKDGFISPMLASAMPEGKTADNFNSEWIAEEKFDGHRLIVRVDAQHVRGVSAWSRLSNIRTLPRHIQSLMAMMPIGVYDGELIVPSSQHSYSVTAGQSTGLEALVLFDMLETNGTSIMNNEFHIRRAFLEIAYDTFTGHDLDLTPPITLAAQFKPSVAAVQEIWDRGGEGAIIKKRSAKYNPGWRSPDWVKVKAVLSAVLTIVGYETGKNGPYSIIRLKDAQGVETTVKTLDNETMRLIQQDPFSVIGRRLVISYQEKMPSGKYRHPMFDHFAGDSE